MKEKRSRVKKRKKILLYSYEEIMCNRECKVIAYQKALEEEKWNIFFGEPAWK